MRIRTTLAGALLALMLAGCSGQDTPAAPPPSTGGQPFLPLFYKHLTHHPAPDTACHPATLEQLLIPCDTPDQP